MFDLVRTLDCNGRELRLDRARVMGIVNVTPDSFSGDGRALAEAAIAHGMKLAEEGADLLDVGGESTRPGAEPVSADDEIARVVPVIEALAKRTELPISVDTYKAAVAGRAIASGATIVNDISGLQYDPELASVVTAAGAALVLMHNRGRTKTMYRVAVYGDVCADQRRPLARHRDCRRFRHDAARAQPR